MLDTTIGPAVVQEAMKEAGAQLPFCRGCKAREVIASTPLDSHKRNGQIGKLHDINLGECKLPNRGLENCCLIQAVNRRLPSENKIGSG